MEERFRVPATISEKNSLTNRTLKIHTVQNSDLIPVGLFKVYHDKFITTVATPYVFYLGGGTSVSPNRWFFIYGCQIGLGLCFHPTNAISDY